MERMGDAHVVKLFRLAQLSIEYLIYTQNYLETLTKTLDMQYKHSYEETERIRDKIKQQSEENAIMKRELKLKQKTLTTYEYLLKLPAGFETQQVRCKQCSKVFI
jgi:zinc finger protein DZIP1